MFLNEKEKKISQKYLTQGYVVENVKEPNKLEWIRSIFCKIIKKNLPKIKENKPKNILNNIHKYVSVPELNKFRLNIINKINSTKNFRENYYKISKNLIDSVVGNEIAMQLRVSLSIQLPKDDSSLLPVHADTWTGVSPFETVVWLPLVDCYKTKSMYILPPKKANELKHLFSDKKIKNTK